ncbi:hypothetical protein LINPERPRIM_LOCUS32790 [Linum perenne]
MMRSRLNQCLPGYGCLNFRYIISIV